MRAGSFYQNYREVRLLVVHCSATRCDRNFQVEALHRCHLARGFASIGYHFYITRDGEVHVCRPVHQIGAHATGWNDKSVGICYEGGLNEDGQPADTRTYAQKCSLLDLPKATENGLQRRRYWGIINSAGSVHKACPCFRCKSQHTVNYKTERLCSIGLQIRWNGILLYHYYCLRNLCEMIFSSKFLAVVRDTNTEIADACNSQDKHTASQNHGNYGSG